MSSRTPNMRKQYRAEQRQICRRLRAINREERNQARQTRKLIAAIEREDSKHMLCSTREATKLQRRLAVLIGRLS